MGPLLLLICLGSLGLACPAQASVPPLQSQEDEQHGGAVKLTRPDGTPVYVNPHQVAFIRGPLPGEEGNTTIVFSSGAKQAVLETVEQLNDIMEEERR